MPIFWGGRRRERLALIREYERGLDAGKEQGWEECKVHFERELAKARQLANDLRQRLADAEVQRRSDVERAHGLGLVEGQAFATFGNRAWAIRETEGQRAS